MTSRPIWRHAKIRNERIEWTRPYISSSTWSRLIVMSLMLLSQLPAPWDDAGWFDRFTPRSYDSTCSNKNGKGFRKKYPDGGFPPILSDFVFEDGKLQTGPNILTYFKTKLIKLKHDFNLSGRVSNDDRFTFTSRAGGPVFNSWDGFINHWIFSTRFRRFVTAELLFIFRRN